MKSVTANKPTHVVKVDVFEALGFPGSEACVLKIKSELLSAVLEEIKMTGYTQAQLADVLDEYRPEVRNLLRGRLSQISIEKLLRYAHRLHLQASIAVRPIEGQTRRTPIQGKQTAHRAARKLALAV